MLHNNKAHGRRDVPVSSVCKILPNSHVDCGLWNTDASAWANFLARRRGMRVAMSAKATATTNGNLVSVPID